MQNSVVAVVKKVPDEKEIEMNKVIEGSKKYWTDYGY